MPRRVRLWQWTDAACCHVINRGHARDTVLHNDDYRRRYGKNRNHRGTVTPRSQHREEMT
jgi:hypothetical protein